MTHTLRTTLLACAAATSLALLAGCSTTGTTTASATATAAAPAPAGPHQQADITFAQQMTVHHQGAIAMADLAPGRASSAAVKDLALQIKAAQTPELQEMAGWLAAWAPSTSAGMTGMAMGADPAGTAAAMPGMMTDAQMGQLTDATGAAFDKLFLQLMIVHHEGVLTMAQTETAQGVNPEAMALARSITTSQSAQIDQMKTMLAGM